MSATKPICSKVSDLEQVSNDIKKTYSAFFDDLVKKLNIDKVKNKDYANEYYSLIDKINKNEKSIRAKNIWKWILIIFLIFPFFILNNQVKNQKVILEGLNKEADKYEKKLQEQLAPLWKHLSWSNVNKNVLQKVLPDYTFNRTIDEKNNNVWNGIIESYQIEDTDTFTDLICGTIYEHPFLIFQLKQQKWIDVPYSASASISYRDSEGHTQTEIVTATVFWPFPIYKSNNYLSYKANIAKDLQFTNSDSLKSKHKLKKFYKKSGQEKMDNEEFDMLFPATRNDEVQFRVIFSVLTQEKFVDLIKTIGKFKMFKYGLYTNVYFPTEPVKSKKHKKDQQSNVEPSTKINYDFNDFNPHNSYDLDEFKEQKTEDIANFVTTFGTLQLPIANLPVYSRELYKETAKPLSNKTSPIQDEAFCNISFNKIFGDKYPTDIIVHTKQISNLKVDKTNCIISEAEVNYFVPVPKIIPTLATGAHGSRMVDVVVQDFRPHLDKYYLVQSNDFSDQFDFFTKTGGRIVNGVFYKLYDHKPNESEIRKELSLIK